MPKSKSDKIDRAIGQRIRAERERKKLTLAALGSRIGVAFNAVAKYERGETSITVSRLVRIAKALGSTIDDFVQRL